MLKSHRGEVETKRIEEGVAYDEEGRGGPMRKYGQGM
jgi:hypothetical protein